MIISEKLLSILVCPESRQSVHLGEQSTVAHLNAGISDGRVQNRAGVGVTERIEGILVREDGKWGYPIRDGIPVMLVDEAIPLQ